MKRILALCLCGTYLVGCSLTPSKITPAKELCSGTKRSYEIKGERYHPQDHYEYEEVGIASWYGPGFHGRPKSCGGTFNMHGLSAAHKTLPIPTVVEVTNLENNRTMKLVVDDRGPFVSTRIIDLSKEAANQLGLHNKGLAQVKVRAIPEESHALAQYLKQFGRYGRHPDGHTWEDIYLREIAGKSFSTDTAEGSILETPYQQHEKEELFYIMEEAAGLPHVPHNIHNSAELDTLLHALAEPAPKASTASKQNTVSSSANLKKTAPSSPLKQHFIQVGSFIQRHNAEKIKGEFTKLGKTEIIQKSASGQKFFNIKIGPFNSPVEAKKVLTRIKKQGHSNAILIN